MYFVFTIGTTTHAYEYTLTVLKPSPGEEWESSLIVSDPSLTAGTRTNVFEDGSRWIGNLELTPFRGIPVLGEQTGPLLGPTVFQGNHKLLERVDGGAVGWVFCVGGQIDGL